MNCTLEKDKKYLVNDVFYNGKGYKLILSENPENCKDGIFYSKKLVVTFDENANIPSLKFNMEQDVPELKINNTALIKHENFIAKEDKVNDLTIIILIFYIFFILSILIILFIIIFSVFERKKKEKFIDSNENKKGFFKRKLPSEIREIPIENNGNYTNDIKRYKVNTLSSPSFSSQVSSSITGNVIGNSIYNSISHSDNTNKTHSISSIDNHSYKSSSYSSDYISSDSYSSDTYSSD